MYFKRLQQSIGGKATAKTEVRLIDTPLGVDPRYPPLAQLVEQLTLNQWVPGSNP